MGKIRLLLVFLSIALLFGCATKEDVQSVARRAYALEEWRAEVETSQKRLEEKIEKFEAEAQKREKRIAFLEKILMDTAKAHEAEIQSVRDQLARLGVDTDSMRTDFRKVLGQLEESEYSMEKGRQTFQKTEEIMAGLNTRIMKLEEALEAESKRRSAEVHAPAQQVTPPPAAAPQPSSQPATTAQAGENPAAVVPVPEDVSDLNEKDLFIKAKEALEKERFEEARTLFDLFLKKFESSRLADNAQYYIGETYFKEKWYEKAILEYQSVIEKFPAGDKVRAALLAQADAFALLKDDESAKLTYKELIKKFPKSSEATQAKKKLEGFK